MAGKGWRGRAPDQAERYDYVIVGAGAAGCVLANRLSSDPAVRVALIEAGGADNHPLIRIPAGVAGLIGHPQLDWRYSTAPQAEAAGRSIPLPRGRVLGGCTSTNGMVYFRGHPGDYDEWAAMGCEGWSYADVLPYFMRSEDNARFRDPAWHGSDGPMRVSSYHRYNRLADRFVRAGAALGYPVVEDFNGPDPAGFGVRQATIRSGRRESAATAFLRHAAARPNLTVIPHALAEQVMFQGRRAAGVNIRCGSQRRTLWADREVIVAAGSYGSPALLQRSGVGDANSLRALGIDVLHHLPQVGANLQDHLVAPVQMITASSLPYVVDARVLPRLLWNLAEYALARRGPLASNIFEATGFVHSDGEGARPDIQLIFMPMHRAPKPIPRQRGYGVLVGLLRPQSRGVVEITSKDADVPPRIDPRFLEDPGDLAPIVRGVSIARSLFAGSQFADLAAQEMLPGAEWQTPDEIADHIRRHCVTVHHPVGTCRMGADDASVVDPQLRVRGVEDLRVADASVMPRIIGGNTAAPVIMIGEKASDLILNRSLAMARPSLNQPGR